MTCHIELAAHFDWVGVLHALWVWTKMNGFLFNHPKYKGFCGKNYLFSIAAGVFPIAFGDLPIPDRDVLNL